MIGARGVRLPLSASQLGIWFAHQIDTTGYAFDLGEYPKFSRDMGRFR